MKNEKLKIGIGLGATILGLVYEVYTLRQYEKIIMKKKEQA